jgi:hypothetical protein
MKSEQWKTYRTRFLVKAKQLNSSLSFTDLLGRQHCGRKGDYLVESCDGVLSIAPRQIFEDIYVPMSQEMSWDMSTEMSREADSAPANGSNGALKKGAARLDTAKIDPAKINTTKLDTAKFDPLPITRIRAQKSRTASLLPAPDPARVRRKSPQPVRPTSTRMGLM